MRKLLAIDIGNTSVVVAFFFGEKMIHLKRVASLDFGSKRRAATFFASFEKLSPSEAVVSSVVPALTRTCIEVVRSITNKEPLVVGPKLLTGFSWGYRSKKTLGADRIADLSAAAAIEKGAVIVADFGTAATFDVLTAEHIFIGGIIAPGPALITDYLCEKTALLPRVEMAKARFAIPGKSTRGAIRTGAMLGYRGMVKEIVAELKEVPELRKARLIATGGCAKKVAMISGLDWLVDPFLTLRGLKRLFDLNS